MDEKGTNVKIYYGESAEPSIDFFVGKSGPDFSSTYVRTNNDNNVYIVHDYLRGIFNKPLKNWKRRYVVKLDKDKIVGLIVEDKKGVKFELQKSNDKWSMIKPKTANVKLAEVNRLINPFSNFFASDIVNEKDPKVTGFDNPSLKVTVKLNDYTSKTFIFGNKNDKNQYYLKRDDEPYTFLVPEYRFNSFNKDPDKLIEEKKEEKKTKQGSEKSKNKSKTSSSKKTKIKSTNKSKK